MRVCFLGLLGCFCLQPMAQAEESRENASAHFPSYVGQSSPNVDLPAQVIAPEGKLFLYADFSQANEKEVPLYVINRSREVVRFAAQDGNIYIKLEHLRPDGTWRRAQAHLSAWCGNSYGTRDLPPGQHFKLAGYRAKKGTPASVRYACYGTVEVISNVGKGLVDPADLEAVDADGLSSRQMPYQLLRLLEPGPLEPIRPGEDDGFRKEVCLVSLELVRVLGGNGTLGIKSKAEGWVRQLSTRASLTKDESTLLSALYDVLARRWTSETDRERLLNRCLQALRTSSPKSAPHGSPESVPSMVWLTLQDLAEYTGTGYALPKPIPQAAWRPVLEMAADQVISAPEGQQQPMIQILSKQAPLMDEWLPDAVVEPWLNSPNVFLVHLAAETLSRRGRWPRLVELGRNLPPDGQIAVLAALVRGQSPQAPSGLDGYGGLRSPGQDTEEERFWQHCMCTQPKQCAGIWRQLGYRSSPHLPYLRFLRKQLGNLLAKQAEESEQNRGEFETTWSHYDARVVLEILVPPQSDRQPDPKEDAPLIALLQRLLTHNGYVTQRGTRSSSNGASMPYEERYFPLRNETSQALKRLGQSVPKDLVTSRDVTPAAEAPKPE